MTRAQIMRLIWIDAFVEAGEFPFRREHLRLAFDISGAQAAVDTRTFRSMFPARLVYSPKQKGYLAAPGSRSAFFPHEHSAVFVACSAAAAAHKRLESSCAS
ncbi:hypothetical protein Shpa_31 [Paracoccus phage Shpa]|uniref:Uncharacterized protein n=1 Tax=Paracoccus phage Shpa TaxID=1647282 RepID=A0A0U2BXV0_9CAUD|nr:hypothetical protein FDG85_gp31 [Paracoccus phage Shpa]AKG94542.1 hypothetical protein Shpa_31 [Paracoccus phage Shpa]